MSIHCPKCGSTKVISRGYAVRKTTGEEFKRCKCNACESWFQIATESVTVSTDSRPQLEFDYYESAPEEFKSEDVIQHQENHEDDFELESPPYPDEDNVDHDAIKSWIRDDDYIRNIKQYDRIVVTSAQNNAEVDEDFFETLRLYCTVNRAKLIVIPSKLRINGDGGAMEYDEMLHPYLVDNDITYPKQRLTILCGMKVIPTAVNPLAGKDARSKGDSLVIGHPQYQMRTMARGFDRKYPPILSTTGSVTIGKYSVTTAGDIAKFNHCAGAVVIELTENDFFIRNLNWDHETKRFYDLDKIYNRHTFFPLHDGDNKDLTIVTGDSHVMFHDEEVYAATFGPSGLVETLKPKYIVRHDILDFHSRSHHSKGDPFQEYSKIVGNRNTVESELLDVVKFLNNTTPEGCTNIIVCSNHDLHLDSWVVKGDFFSDALNAKIGHWIAFKKYHEMGKNGGKPIAALPLFCKELLEVDTMFLKETDTFKLHGIELAIHGHNGLNGSRGSAMQMSRMPDKLVCGHSHSPQVNKGCYQVGTSSIFHMGYVKSPSSWDHVHCIIYPNGKRQMIHLRDGKFRR